MPSTTLEDAQAHLAAWIAQLRPGEELVIVEKDRPVARLVTVAEGNVAETFASQAESARHAGWSHPLMDEYNEYDFHRLKQSSAPD